MGQFDDAVSNYREDANEKPKNSKSLGHGPCEVYGCPKDGHIQTEGRWNCRYHHNKHGEKLHRITLALKNYSSDFYWYEKILTMNSVRFSIGDVVKLAPAHLRVGEMEDWKSYSARIKARIDGLLSS